MNRATPTTLQTTPLTATEALIQAPRKRKEYKVNTKTKSVKINDRMLILVEHDLSEEEIEKKKKKFLEVLNERDPLKGAMKEGKRNTMTLFGG